MTDFETLTRELMQSCAALLMHLEGAQDAAGNLYFDPALQCMDEARERIEKAKQALREARIVSEIKPGSGPNCCPQHYYGRAESEPCGSND